jgi:hypothetical protein
MCRVWKWEFPPTNFCLYDLPDYRSDAKPSSVNFLSLEPDDTHQFGAVPLFMRIFWGKIPLLGRLKAAATSHEEECAGEPAFELYFLPEKLISFGFWGSIHGHISASHVTELQTTLRRIPTNPKRQPPKWMIEQSQNLGGFPDGFKDYLEMLGNRTRRCRARGEFGIVNDRLKFKQPEIRSDIGPFHVSDVEFKLHQKQDNTFVKVDFFGGTYTVEVQSNLKLRPNERSFENASDLLVEKLEPLFKKK